MPPVILECLFVRFVHSVLHTGSHCAYLNTSGPLWLGWWLLQLYCHTPGMTYHLVSMRQQKLLRRSIKHIFPRGNEDTRARSSQRNLASTPHLSLMQEMLTNALI